MPGQKFIAIIANKLKEIAGLQISAGAADANKLISTNSVGVIDVTLLPPGIGAEVVNAPTTENIAAGDFVNLYQNSGVISLRKADASTNTKPVNGFVIANSTYPANATMYILGTANNFRTGLTIGNEYVLSKTVPGGVTDISTFVGTAGNILQPIGKAISATSMLTSQNVNYVEIT